MASLAPGHRLGPYEMIEPIGAGGMGEVWKARDTRLDRIVAIKICKEQFSERFEREACAVAALNHPHVCQLYDIGPNYLVMEFIEGEALKGPLPLTRAVEYAGQILDALDAAHRKGITHRDLKPGNILVTKQGIKLLDFGLATQTGPLQETDVTRALTEYGQILGTLQYMSPEQLQSKPTDGRSDLFSFGCVLYEMLTGKPAFEGQSAASVIAAILEREPAPLTAAPPLERVVRRALAKDPDQRFQTALDLKAAMNWAMEQPAPVASSKRARGSPWIAAAVLASIALTAWTTSRFNKQPMDDDRVYSLSIDPPEGFQHNLGDITGGFALSPDGRTVAFIAAGSGSSSLWLRALDGSGTRQIPGSDGASRPFWSPDSKSLGFFTQSKLKRVDLSGGNPLVLCDVPSGKGGAWTTDGRIIFAPIASSLMEVAQSSGKPSPLTSLDPLRGESAHRWPQVLPGGRLLFHIVTSNAETTGMYLATLAKPSERALVLRTPINAVFAPDPANSGRGYLFSQRGGTLLVQRFDPDTRKFTGEPQKLADRVASTILQSELYVAVVGRTLLYSSSTLSSQLTWFDRTGKSQGGVGAASEFRTFRLSPDARQILASVDASAGGELWQLDVDRGASSRFPGAGYHALWSPDGRTVVFNSGVPQNLVRREASGAGQDERLSYSPNLQVANDWSRDGQWLLYFEINPQTQRDLWVLRMSTDGRPLSGASPAPYLRTPDSEAFGRFSPESPPHWVAYQSDETHRWEVYVQAFPEARNKIAISTGGGQYPQWRADGLELFYVSPDNKLMAVELKAEGGTLRPSTPHELFRLPIVDTGRPPYDVTPDGQRFLVRAVSGQAGQPLSVIVNWPALLKKEGAAP
jgi:serine/threonine protein kinase